MSSPAISYVPLLLLLVAAGLLATCVWLRLRGSRLGVMAEDAAPLSAGRALALGLLSGGATALVASAAALALAGSPAAPPGSLLAQPGVVAGGCVATLLLFFDGRATLRRWLVPSTVLAAGVPLTLAAVPPELGVAAPADPLLAGLVAAVLCGVFLSTGRRARLVAMARVAATRAAGDGILVVDGKGRTLYANQAARSSVDVPAPRGAGRAPLPAAIQSLLSEPRGRRVRLKSGSGRFFEAWVTGTIRGIRALLIRDITGKYRDERRLVRLAHYDSLTGLANRRLFLENLTHALEAANAVRGLGALLYLDLDHFKEINDSMGHSAGDSLLQTLAERLREYFATENLEPIGIQDGSRIRIARLGGDEFAVIAPRITDPETAAELSRRLLQLIAKPVVISDRTLSHSVSVGISLFPDDSLDVEQVIRQADAALYAAKTKGRNRYAFYEPSFDAKAERKHAIEQGLRTALERGEFRLHYQPKVDVATQAVVGFEALLRWTNAEMGKVGPAEFIPIAEERRLIGAIGEWCLDEACRQLKSWAQEGFEPVPVAVNVSSAQFQETDLQRVVTGALQKHGVSPQLLELELTETLLLADGEETALTLRDLRAIGIRIALDDFGTGYSALTYLNRFQLDILKMDRGLLCDIESDPAAAGIASAVVSMAHSLGLAVVAEGVDSEGQVPLLRQMNCDQIQGFLYAPALPVEEAQRFLARQGKRAPQARPVTAAVARPAEIEEVAAPAPVVPEPRVDSDLPSMREPDPQPDPPPQVDGDLPSVRSVHPSEEAFPVEVGFDTVGEENRRLLLLDDGEGTLGPLAMRLARMGIDLHYASGPDEGLLFVAQEKAAITLLVAPPSVEPAGAKRVVDALGRELGAPPPLLVLGEEPDAATRARLREAGTTWVLWTPFDDTEVRFVIRSATALPQDLAQRREPRVPVDLVAKVHAGSRREVAVLSSLSPRGAFIEMADPPAVESQLRLEFELGPDRFRFFARVVHCQQEDPDRTLSPTAGMGVVFFGPDRQVEQALRKAVEERASRYLP